MWLHRVSSASLPPRRPRRGRRHRAGDFCVAQFFEAELASELFHDGDPEVGLFRCGKFDGAIGLVNSHELRAFLEFFFGHTGNGAWSGLVK